MAKRIRIKAGQLEAVAELNDTNTAEAIWEALPIKGRANLWGDEIYFTIPISVEQEAGQELVNIGDLGYWPPGKGFCIFFGPTPMSEGESNLARRARLPCLVRLLAMPLSSSRWPQEPRLSSRRKAKAKRG